MTQVSPPQDSPEHAAPSLTPRQRTAVLAMVCFTSYADAAHRANVGLSTLKRWMKQPEFLDELDRLHGEALDIANAQIQGLMLRAVANLDAAMANSNPNIQLAATRMTLQYGCKLTQLNESRLQAQLAVSHIEDAGIVDSDTEDPDTEDPDTEDPDTEDLDTEDSDTEDSDTEDSDTEDSDTEDPDIEDPDFDATGNESSPAQTPFYSLIPATELAFPVTKPVHSLNGAVAEWPQMDRNGPKWTDFEGSAECPNASNPQDSQNPLGRPPNLVRG